MKKKYIIFSLTIILLTLFDQLSKIIVINNFELYDSVILINNFLKFYYLENTGASFGILNGYTLLIILISILMIIYLIKEIKNHKESNLLLISSSLIISGAFGNLIDRIFRGYVIDFISFTLFNREMPVFNLADTFITIGVILYIIMIFMESSNERNNSK